jgi:hypothetical protein
VFHFLQPEWLWLLALLPLALLWRGRKGTVAAVQYSSVGLARAVARDARSRIGRWVWLLPVLGAAFLIVGLARPQLAHGRTEVTANGIDIMLGLDVSGSMQAMDFRINGERVNRIEVVKSVVSKFIDERPGRPHRCGGIRRRTVSGEPADARSRLAAPESRSSLGRRRRRRDGHRLGHRDRRQPAARLARQIEGSSSCSPTA